MPIPDYQSIMLPLLKLLSNKKEHDIEKINETLAGLFKLTAEERKKRQPSGKVNTFCYRVKWAQAYLVAAGLLDITRRRTYKITQRGLEL